MKSQCTADLSVKRIKKQKRKNRKEKKETGNWEPIKWAFVWYDKIWLNRASTKINEMGGATWEEDWESVQNCWVLAGFNLM